MITKAVNGKLYWDFEKFETPQDELLDLWCDGKDSTLSELMEKIYDRSQTSDRTWESLKNDLIDRKAELLTLRNKPCECSEVMRALAKKKAEKDRIGTHGDYNGVYVSRYVEDGLSLSASVDGWSGKRIYWYIDDRRLEDSMHIKYCPLCGKKLEILL